MNFNFFNNILNLFFIMYLIFIRYISLTCIIEKFSLTDNYSKSYHHIYYSIIFIIFIIYNKKKGINLFI
jgi:hypothetical protein